MSVNPPEGTLTIENSHLDVKGNVSAVALKLGTLRLTPSYGLDAVANVSNSTTHTLELSNATTGLVTTANLAVGGELTVTGNTTVSSNLTVSGNATVTGDLNVSGALGILDAIYPVGTVIDRATAITDTHLNGKYKAFLAAPNQEWELTKSPSTTVAFRADNNTTATYAAYTQHAFQVTKINMSNSFANNVFTAPSDGQYVLGLHLNTYQDTSIINGFRKKAVGESAFSYFQDMMQPHGSSSTNYGELSKSMLFTLNEGDQIDVSGRTALTVNSMNGDSTVSLSHYIFWGHKVGSHETSSYVYKRTV